MNTFLTNLDLIFSPEGPEQLVLREVTSFPPSELSRILNRSEISRVVGMTNRGSVKDAWDTLGKAIDTKNHDQISKSLSKLIIAYSLVVAFLSQPENKRLNWIKNFLRTSSQEEK